MRAWRLDAGFQSLEYGAGVEQSWGLTVSRSCDLLLVGDAEVGFTIALVELMLVLD